MAIEVVPVDSALRWRQFFDLAFRIYRNDPCFVAPVEKEVRRGFDPRHHHYFDHAEAAVFLALQDGEPVARAAAFLDRFEPRFARFGYFESVDNPAAAHTVLQAVCDWQRARGARELRGPANFSEAFEYAVQIDGFGDPPAVETAYNPRYYPRLLEAFGFEKHYDHFAFRFRPAGLDRAKLARARRFAASSGVTFRPLTVAEVRRRSAEFFAVYHRAFEMLHEGASRRFSEREFEDMLARKLPFADAHYSAVFEQNGRLAGFLLVTPDWNQALIGGNGKLGPLGLLRSLWRRRLVTRARANSIGILPEMRGTGAAALMANLIDRYDSGGKKYDMVDCSLIREDNQPALSIQRAIGAELYKRYRSYRLAL